MTAAERRANYEAYLASPAWQRLRVEVLERDSHACRTCASTKRLDIHHRTYQRFGHEDLNDLTTLCRRCHEKHHGFKLGTGKKPKRQGASRNEKRPAVLRAVMQMEPGRTYTTKELAALSGISAPTVVLKDLVEEGKLWRASKRQWNLPHVIAPARATDPLRQLPAQLVQRVETRCGPGRPSPLDKHSLRAEQDRKSRAEKRGPTSTG